MNIIIAKRSDCEKIQRKEVDRIIDWSPDRGAEKIKQDYLNFISTLSSNDVLYYVNIFRELDPELMKVYNKVQNVMSEIKSRNIEVKMILFTKDLTEEEITTKENIIKDVYGENSVVKFNCSESELSWEQFRDIGFTIDNTKLISWRNGIND
ncbi:MAG: hypothetical protein ACOC3V_04845 [bacterium]